MVKAFRFPLPGYCDDEEDEDTAKGDEDGVDVDDDDDTDIFDHLPRHGRCYAHTLQLVVKDGLKDCSAHVRIVIAKASSIVSQGQFTLVL